MATENIKTELQKSDLDLAKKTHQVLVPQNVYIGDSAELRVSFSSENAHKLLKDSSFVELPLSNFVEDLQFQDYQIEKITLLSNGQNNYNFVITFIPWKTGNINFPNYNLLPEENVILKFETVSISSLLKDESVGLQEQAAPLLLPGTAYKVYGILILSILVLFVGIRLIVKRDSVSSYLKRRKLLKKYKKNKKSTIKNLSKILKNKDLSDVDFASNIQNAMRNYLEVRFDFPFTKTVSSEIKEKYLFAVESASEQKVCAIECIQKIFCQTDIIRYGQKSFGINKTSFLENEKETLVDQLIQSIETLEIVEVFEIENKEKNIKEGENNA
jgi:hypothetical protein